jgi:RNA polymerase sigma factor (TIGR02999 family)
MPAERIEIAPVTGVTQLLAELRRGRREAFDELFGMIYQELRGLAHRVRRGQASDTLSTTALVHEAYLKLSASCAFSCEDRRHFFSVAARAMRQIIVDRSREVLAEKRGGARIHLSLGGLEVAVEERARQLVHLDEALERLSLLDARLAQVVELRFFAGLTVEDTSGVLETSPRTVKRDWRRARAFLLQALQSDEASASQVP